MGRIKITLANFFYGIAIWLDPRLPKWDNLIGWKDVAIYGTHIQKRIDPRDLWIDPLAKPSSKSQHK